MRFPVCVSSCYRLPRYQGTWTSPLFCCLIYDPVLWIPLYTTTLGTIQLKHLFMRILFNALHRACRVRDVGVWQWTDNRQCVPVWSRRRLWRSYGRTKLHQPVNPHTMYGHPCNTALLLDMHVTIIKLTCHNFIGSWYFVLFWLIFK